MRSTGRISTVAPVIVLVAVAAALLPARSASADPPCEPHWAEGFMPFTFGVDGPVLAMTIFDDGSGPGLHVGGHFLTAGGGAAVSGVAKWNGSGWSPLGSGTSGIVNALTVFDDGSGPALYAGGQFFSAGGVAATRIAKWDGSSWSSLGSGMGGAVYSLTGFDDGSGPALYAGGNFHTAGGELAHCIAKWDGSTWSALGSGMDYDVHALTVFDDGNVPALYAGGWFTTAGGTMANGIAKWNGSTWSPVGSGVSGFPAGAVHALTVFDDGSGPSLYAGGYFTSAGGVAANRIAKWNGDTWAPLGGGMDDRVTALTMFDDGHGVALFAGGLFTSAGGLPASCIAKWNGVYWSTLGSGIGGAFPSSYVAALAVFEDDGSSVLYAGGEFHSAGGVEAQRIAKWVGCAPAGCAGDADCDGDVDFFDIDPFVAKLGCPALGAACNDGCAWENADVDTDGDVDFFDIDPFVARLGAMCP